MTTWTERDLPLLQHLNDNPPTDGLVSTNWLSEAPFAAFPQLTEQQAYYAFDVLLDAGYVTFGHDSRETSGGVMWLDVQVTGLGKQALGDWPMFDALGDPAQLESLLNALADIASTDEEETNLRHAAEGAGRLSREGLQQLLAGVLGALARSQLGG